VNNHKNAKSITAAVHHQMEYLIILYQNIFFIIRFIC